MLILKEMQEFDLLWVPAESPTQTLLWWGAILGDSEIH